MKRVSNAFMSAIWMINDPNGEILFIWFKKKKEKYYISPYKIIKSPASDFINVIIIIYYITILLINTVDAMLMQVLLLDYNGNPILYCKHGR